MHWTLTGMSVTISSSSETSSSWRSWMGWSEIRQRARWSPSMHRECHQRIFLSPLWLRMSLKRSSTLWRRSTRSPGPRTQTAFPSTSISTLVMQTSSWLIRSIRCSLRISSSGTTTLERGATSLGSFGRIQMPMIQTAKQPSKREMKIRKWSSENPRTSSRRSNRKRLWSKRRQSTTC